MKKRILSMLLVLCMVFTMMPIGAFAAETGTPTGTSSVENLEEPIVCENHKAHDENCGYQEAIKTAPAQAESPCDRACAALSGDGVIIHTENCAYLSASEEIPAVKGADCTHECALCNPVEREMAPSTNPECICETKCTQAAKESDTTGCLVCGAENADLSLCVGVAAMLTAAPRAIPRSIPTEQFTLTTGLTYYFDLSGEAGTITSGVSSTMGKINAGSTAPAYPGLPDASLHYVPFTYAGTVNAYSLTSGQASADAAASPRSLFVADYTISHSISWNELNTANLIFGKEFGTSYTLRTLSAGSSKDNNTGTPSTNEWDGILEKSGSTDNDTGGIKNWSNLYSWGQDTIESYADCRAVRGFSFDSTWPFSNAADKNSLLGWRPALEVSDALSSDAMKAVTLDLNGGSFDSKSTIMIVCAGSSFAAPSAEGLTVPSNKADAELLWNTAKDGTGTSYAAGASVPGSVTTLYAQWTEPLKLYDLWVGGVQVTSANADNITGAGITGTISYAADSSTLTLKDAAIDTSYELPTNYKAGIYSTGVNLTIKIEGANTITGEAANSGKASYGIFGQSGTLTISESGTGRLEVTGGSDAAQSLSTGMYASNGIAIKSGTVIAKGGEASNNSYGIYNGKSIEISGGTVAATGGTSTHSYGIYSSGSSNVVSISGGTVTATGGEAANNSSGICGSAVSISGGTVTATGGEAVNYCYGILGDAINILGGSIIAKVTSTSATGEKKAFENEPTLTSYANYQWRTAIDGTFTPSETSAYIYDASHNYVEIAVAAAVPTLTWASDTQTLTYTGSAVAITAPVATGIGGETPSGAISYAYKKVDGFTRGLFADYTDGLPTDAGKYEIKASIAASGNYEKADSTNLLKLTVENFTPTLTIGTGYTGKVFDGAAMANPTQAQMTITGAAYADVSFVYSKSADMSDPLTAAPTNAGSYYVQASTAEKANTNAATSAAVSFEITKAAAPTVAAPSNVPMVQGMEIAYTFDLSTLAMPADAGETIYNVGIIKGQSLFHVLPTVVGSQLHFTPTAAAQAGQTAQAVMAITCQNYKDTTATITFEFVSKTVVDISGISVANSTYNGTAAAYTGTPVAKDGGQIVSISGYDYAWRTAAGAPLTEAPKNAGDYVLTVSVKSSDTAYTGAKDVPFSIGKCALTITAENKAAFAGETAPAFSYTQTGLVNGETISGVSFACDYVKDDPTNGAAKTYVIEPSGAVISSGSDNYVITYTNGTLTVTVNTAALAAVIAGAANAKTGVAVLDDKKPSEVDNGKKFVSSAAMNALAAAIAQAESVKASAATAQQVTDAVTALNSAITAFQAAVQTGTYTASSGGGASAVTYTITATAGAGGEISTGKYVRVGAGESAGFTFIPHKGYQVADVLVNGKSVGAVTGYVFTDVRASQTIHVTFKTANGHANPQTGAPLTGGAKRLSVWTGLVLLSGGAMAWHTAKNAEKLLKAKTGFLTEAMLKTLRFLQAASTIKQSIPPVKRVA